jgi:hypothetical protein
MWSAEDALGLWDCKNRKRPTDPCEPWAVVDTLTGGKEKTSDHVRLNIFLALCTNGCVLKQEDCCLTCAIAQGKASELSGCGKRIVWVAGIGRR